MNYRRPHSHSLSACCYRASRSKAAVIPGLFPSGVDPNGTILPSGSMIRIGVLVRAPTGVSRSELHWS